MKISATTEKALRAIAEYHRLYPPGAPRIMSGAEARAARPILGLIAQAAAQEIGTAMLHRAREEWASRLAGRPTSR